MISQEILLEFMFEINVFKENIKKYNLAECKIVLTHDMFLEIKDKMHFNNQFDKIAKCLLGKIKYLKVGLWENTPVFIYFDILLPHPSDQEYIILTQYEI